MAKLCFVAFCCLTTDVARGMRKQNPPGSDVLAGGFCAYVAGEESRQAGRRAHRKCALYQLLMLLVCTLPAFWDASMKLPLPR